MGAKISKLYSSYKSQPRVFTFFLNFLPDGPHKSTVLDFFNFEFAIFNNFSLFCLTWDPMGAKSSKRYSSIPQITLEYFETSHKTSQKKFEILSYRFLTIFPQNFKFSIVAYGEIKNLNYLENERS